MCSGCCDGSAHLEKRLALGYSVPRWLLSLAPHLLLEGTIECPGFRRVRDTEALRIPYATQREILPLSAMCHPSVNSGT